MIGKPLNQGEPDYWVREPWQKRDFLRFFMIGADGSRWAFGGVDSPVRLNKPPTGINGAPVTHDYQKLTGLDGAVYRGSMDEQATIGLQVWVKDARSSAWARRKHSDWRRAFGRGKDTVRLYAISKESGYWWIDARLQSVSEVNFFDQNPGLVGETGELVTLITDRAFWESFEVFTDTELPASHGTEYTFQVEVPNRGDQNLWPRYEITGGFTTVELGVGTLVDSERQTITSTLFGYQNMPSPTSIQEIINQVGTKYTASIQQLQTLINSGLVPGTTDPDTGEPTENNAVLEMAKQVYSQYGADVSAALDAVINGGKSTYVVAADETVYIDTNPLWPSIVTSKGTDLTPYLPDVHWKNPIPALGSHAETQVRIKATGISEDFKVKVLGTPRSETAW